MAYVRIRPRRSTAEEWEYNNPILAEGEMGIEVPPTGVGTGIVQIKFGDGVTSWKDLPYGIETQVYEEYIKEIQEIGLRIDDADTIETDEIVVEDSIDDGQDTEDPGMDEEPEEDPGMDENPEEDPGMDEEPVE